MLYSGENCNCNCILCGEGWERQCNELCFIVGKIVTVMVYCVVGVGKGQRNELCFKTAYRNCECNCANVTSSKTRLSLGLLQNVQIKIGLFSFSSHFQREL